MKHEQKKEAERWPKQAEQDAAEKALKSFLYAHGAEEVWGHLIAELAYDAEKLNKEFGELRSEISSFDKYYIPTRYPAGLPGGIPAEAFDAEDAEKAIRLAKQTINFVKKKSGLMLCRFIQK
ncbi:MAG: HEPN domain-containing protein [Candidatus Bilamarchaeaceae archaeon]